MVSKDCRPPSVDLFRDLRYAWRALWRRPGLAVVALLTLALGIGVSTAIFSVFYGLILHPLPYRQPEQLVRIWATYRDAGESRAPLSGLMLSEIQRRNRSLSDVGAIWVVQSRTFLGDTPEQPKSAHVTANFFDVLGVGAGEGRTFLASDASTPAVVLRDSFFRRRFLGDASWIGRGLPTTDTPAVLAGVLPDTFQIQFAPDANVPPDVQVFDVFANNLPRQTARFLRVVGRRKPDVTLAATRQDLERVAAELRAAFPNLAENDAHFSVASLQDDAFADVGPALRALFAGAVFVLAICCVNVTSLLIARASERRREIALRLAIEASRARILRQLVIEAMVLCTLGGFLGWLAGLAGFRGLLAVRPDRLAHLAEVDLSWPTFFMAAVASFFSAWLFGLAPAIQCFRFDLIATLRSGGRVSVSRFQRRAGAALVVAEIALGFVLVTCATLTARTLTNIERVRPGFDAANRLTFQMPVGYRPAEREAVTAWEQELATLPGVERVGAISHLPLDHDLPNWYGPYGADRQSRPDDVAAADFRSITPGYFDAMGVRLIEGRVFNDGDRSSSTSSHAPPVIIDDIVARTAWPGASSIGRTLEVDGEKRTVVGVVEHVRGHSLTEDVRGIIYLPYGQSPRSPLTFVLRAHTDPLPLVSAIRARLRQRSPNVALSNVRLMTDYVDRATAPMGFTAVLAMLFGVLALVLAATGIYGVLNYQVSRRLPELGIRTALGATGGDLLRLVLREGVVVALLGVGCGLLLSLSAGHWLRLLLYGVSALDPLSHSLALLLLPAAVLVGCWRPARRAAANAVDMIRDE